ncbi:PepSY1/2 domain-containing protein [Salsuginibacillus halophilus]|uniref:PepSY1/2 domain-containing protein n=1 Tax=Salsuginibacillus halophilus TaxID=517424 RepID=UPI0015E68187|nr:PepSY1/2 domain-containing protein [Salsuginibacillus halophilus]
MKRWHLFIVIGLLLAVISLQAYGAANIEDTEDESVEQGQLQTELHTYMMAANAAEENLAQSLAAAEESDIHRALNEAHSWLQVLSFQTGVIDMSDIEPRGHMEWSATTHESVNYMEYLIDSEEETFSDEEVASLEAIRERLRIMTEHMEAFVGDEDLNETVLEEELDTMFAEMGTHSFPVNIDETYQEVAHQDSLDNLTLLDEEEVSEEAMKETAAAVMQPVWGDVSQEELTVAQEGMIADDLGTVGYTLADEETYIVEVTKRGGEVLQVFEGEHDAEGEGANREEAEALSEELLESWADDADLELTDVEGDGEQYAFFYAAVEDEVLIHPRRLRVQINSGGNLESLSAFNYYQDIDVQLEPEVGEDEAREAVSEHIILTDDEAALEVVEIAEEPELVYVFNVEAPEHMGPVKINAEDGEFTGLRKD